MFKMFSYRSILNKLIYLKIIIKSIIYGRQNFKKLPIYFNFNYIFKVNHIDNTYTFQFPLIQEGKGQKKRRSSKIKILRRRHSSHQQAVKTQFLIEETETTTNKKSHNEHRQKVRTKINIRFVQDVTHLYLSWTK